MKTFTAHLKSGETPVLVREGWSWGGFFLGPFWLLTQGAWIPALLEAAVVVTLLAAAPHQVWTAGAVGLSLLTGCIGRDFVRWSLDRQGLRLDHVVVAPDRDAALLRLFSARPDLMDPAR